MIATATTLKQDKTGREHGRYLYRVYVDGECIGRVARWEDERRWTMYSEWLPSKGSGETYREAGLTARTRKEAVAEIAEAWGSDRRRV